MWKISPISWFPFSPQAVFFSNPWKLGTKKVHAYAVFFLHLKHKNLHVNVRNSICKREKEKHSRYLHIFLIPGCYLLLGHSHKRAEHKANDF